MEGLVETSDNVAVLSTENNEVQVLISLRSSSPQQLDELTERIVTVSRQWGASPAVGEGYPPWEPQVGSALLDKCVSLYQKTFGKTPVVKSIHAGLECGIIGSKFEGMEMISMGPDIENPHSPDEIMNVSSLKRLREYLAVLLDSISRENGC
jgi:dipeptidase D